MKHWKELPSITLTKDDFGDKLWDKVGELISILTRSRYQVIVDNEMLNDEVIVIRYVYLEGDLTEGDLVLLDWDEHIVCDSEQHDGVKPEEEQSSGTPHKIYTAVVCTECGTMIEADKAVRDKDGYPFCNKTCMAQYYDIGLQCVNCKSYDTNYCDGQTFADNVFAPCDEYTPKGE